MKLTSLLVCLLLLQVPGFGQNSPAPNPDYQADFAFFWDKVNSEYSYFDKKQTDWQKVKQDYFPLAARIKTRAELVDLLEAAIRELYDHHAILNTNTDSSRRLVPSGTDIWAEYRDGKPLVTELRRGLGAANAGIRAGMELLAVNGEPVEQALQPFLPRCLKAPDPEAKNYALRLLLAGNHVRPRQLTFKYKGKVADYFPDASGLLLENLHPAQKLEMKWLGRTAYIRINDCLYDNELIPAFDSAMQAAGRAASLILDLRETASGGNTSVAKAILGWFIQKEFFYQKHEYPGDQKESGIKNSWVEIVSPRKGKYFGGRLAVLCDHWTGSMGEGIVVGFDALRLPNIQIIGTPMAALNGAVYTYEMPSTKIGFTFPAERLYHISGQPRELFIPPLRIHPEQEIPPAGKDPFVTRALQYLNLRK